MLGLVEFRVGLVYRDSTTKLPFSSSRLHYLLWPPSVRAVPGPPPNFSFRQKKELYNWVGTKKEHGENTTVLVRSGEANHLPHSSLQGYADEIYDK